MLAFSTADGTTINHLAARILDLPLEEVPNQPGTYACRASGTGNEVGSAFVGTIAHKLYRNVFALRYQHAATQAPEKQE